LQAKAFTENSLRRKPVLKEKINSFFGKAFFSKERFVLKEKSMYILHETKKSKIVLLNTFSFFIKKKTRAKRKNYSYHMQ